MKRLKKFQPELVVRAFPEQDSFFINNPASVNKGLCMRWAYLAYRMFPGVELWSIPAHAFIRYDRKFYDSERLQGVDDWKDLPACNFGMGCGCIRCRTSDATLHTTQDFKRRWNANPIKPNWRWYRQLASSFVEKVSSDELVS